MSIKLTAGHLRSDCLGIKGRVVGGASARPTSSCAVGLAGTAHVAPDRANPVNLLAHASWVGWAMVGMKILVIAVIDNTLGTHQIAGVARFINNLAHQLHVGQKLVKGCAFIFGKGIDYPVQIDTDADT